MPLIEEQYVKTGVVRIAYRDYPLEIHASAMLAAVAGRCAAAQGQFWPMHDRLFLTHGEEWGGVPKRDRDVFVEFAGELQLDIGAFERCLDDPATEEAVRQEAAAAERAGVRATPNFFIDGELVQGAQPFGVFQQMIEQARGQ